MIEILLCFYLILFLFVLMLPLFTNTTISPCYLNECWNITGYYCRHSEKTNLIFFLFQINVFLYFIMRLFYWRFLTFATVAFPHMMDLVFSLYIIYKEALFYSIYYYYYKRKFNKCHFLAPQQGLAADISAKTNSLQIIFNNFNS